MIELKQRRETVHVMQWRGQSIEGIKFCGRELNVTSEGRLAVMDPLHEQTIGLGDWIVEKRDTTGHSYIIGLADALFKAAGYRDV